MTTLDRDEAWTALAHVLIGGTLSKAAHRRVTWIERYIGLSDEERAAAFALAMPAIDDPTDDTSASILCDWLEEHVGYVRGPESAPELAVEIVYLLSTPVYNPVPAKPRASSITMDRTPDGRAVITIDGVSFIEP